MNNIGKIRVSYSQVNQIANKFIVRVGPWSGLSPRGVNCIFGSIRVEATDYLSCSKNRRPKSYLARVQQPSFFEESSSPKKLFRECLGP